MSEAEARLGDVAVVRQTGWSKRFPRLLQGLTSGRTELDFSVPTGPGSPLPDPWARLLSATGAVSLVRVRQVHGSHVQVIDEDPGPGLQLGGPADALVTDRCGVLLTVTVADCVPVYVVHRDPDLLGLAHAGWRGIAAGVVEATLEAMCRLGADPARIQVHLGPAICRDCYEVGPEVPAALGLAGRPSHVDLRAAAADRAGAVGVDVAGITFSPRCTRCGPGPLFSHRGGDRGARMCAFLGRGCR